MTTTFNKNVPHYFNLIDDNGNVFTDSNYNTTLTSGGGAQDVAVPLQAGMGGSVGSINKYLAVIIPEQGTTVFASNSGTAVLPGASFAQSGSELIPVQGMSRYVKAGSTISLITSSTSSYVSVKFYFVN